MLDDIPVEDQYVFTSMRFDNGMKRSSSSTQINQLCCPEAKAVYLLKYHYDRLVQSADSLGWFDIHKAIKGPVDLCQRVQNVVVGYQKKTKSRNPRGAFKVRAALRHNGKLEFDVQPILSTIKSPLLFPTTLDLSRQSHDAASKRPIFKVVLDVLPTRISNSTKRKTHYRTMYNYARHCASIQSYQDAKEVLLFNNKNEIMDASICTPYLYREGAWVTPHSDCGGQQGVTRRWAIDQGLCSSGSVSVSSLRHGEIIWLSNAVKGFFTAKVVLCNGDRRARAPSYTSSDSTSAASSLASSNSFGAMAAAVAACSVEDHEHEHEHEKHDSGLDRSRSHSQSQQSTQSTQSRSIDDEDQDGDDDANNDDEDEATAEANTEANTETNTAIEAEAEADADADAVAEAVEPGSDQEDLVEPRRGRWQPEGDFKKFRETTFRLDFWGKTEDAKL